MTIDFGVCAAAARAALAHLPEMPTKAFDVGSSHEGQWHHFHNSSSQHHNVSVERGARATGVLAAHLGRSETEFRPQERAQTEFGHEGNE